ncbi:MAG TPA: response regulator [Niabella sp.]|nr:response regulator [Niabella sp.]HOZ97086.1 response regulator [Niabella sp.]HQW15286.1 response regulator [Niabella sp.]HQX20464.1 response regulator [Niabella sp.]HQX42673.1 response regulator [Niabella sp.]
MKKVLIIEDNDEVRENLAEILELSGYNVITAPDGKPGVELAIKEIPDLIICDIMMPGLDGYGVVYMLNQNTRTSRIPFIFLTAKSERSAFRKAMELGADDFLTKPFEGIELLKAVETRLNKAQSIQQQFEQSKEADDSLDSFLNHVKKSGQLPLLSEDREVINYVKKQQIYSEGQRPKALYFIKSGKVKTFKVSDNGKELITNVLGKGDFIGYTYVLENMPYKESAEILEDASIMIIPKEDFLSLIAADTGIARQFIRLITNNVLEKEESLLNIAYNSLRKKVAFQLIVMLEKFKLDMPDTKEIKLSRDNLAQATGIATESLIRTLSDFRMENLVDLKGGSIIILNEAKLRNLPY